MGEEEKTKRSEELQKWGIFIGAVATIVAAFIGLIPWFAEDDTESSESRIIAPEAPRETNHETESITVSISTVLGPNQYAESVDIYIEGVLEGTLDVSNLYNTGDTVNITLDRAGRYDYELYSTTQALSMNGLVYDYTGYGSGTLNFSDGNHYDVMLMNYQSNPWQIALR